MFDSQPINRPGAFLQRFFLENLPVSRRFSVKTALTEEIQELVEFTRKQLPEISADLATIRQIQAITSSILLVRNQSRGKLVGMFAILPLNSVGLDQLQSGVFNFSRPEIECLSRPGELTAAIYGWALCLPGTSVAAVGNIMEWLKQNGYSHADIYAWPGTSAGQVFQEKTGFKFYRELPDGRSIWVYRRRCQGNQ